MEENNTKNKYESIENYGIIGDLHTVALVSMAGSIDFMSFTRFDSPTVFAGLLDAGKGGSFSIYPTFSNPKRKQQYLPDTAILVTRFFSDEGIAELTDFMPAMEHEYHCAIIRKITSIRGDIKYQLRCAPRFDYALASHVITEEKEGLLFEADDKNNTKARLLGSIPIEIDGNDGYAAFTLKEGETACFVFESIPNQEQRNVPLEEYVSQAYKTTIRYWHTWIEQSTYKGRWREVVNRSALTLKLLTSHRYGSVIAAPTFGLPEVPGGERNWDYRYTWIRDASFSMYAFLSLGFKEEAAAFLNWIRKQCVNNQLQLMYAVDGETQLDEQTLDHLEGYKGSKPVRIGNKAHEQFQLDIYGELIDTVYLYNKHVAPITYDFWQEIRAQVEFVAANWFRPDHGIWEIRGGEKEFLHSRIMCWVAVDRAIKIAEGRSFPYPYLQWHKVRDDIYKDIFEHFWSEEKQSFVQYKGSEAVDASALLMPMMRFISPFEEKWKKTLKAIGNELGTDVLIYRYRNNMEHIDGLDGEEGTFTMCSFWYVECLAKSGHIEQAREHFEKMLGYANHLGLFAEQLGRKAEHLGNFPQAFTHLALISAAVELDKDLEKTFATAE